MFLPTSPTLAGHCDQDNRNYETEARREEDFFVGRFGLQIERWLLSELDRRGGRAKSINLPAGRVGIRSVGSKLEVLDLDAVLAWAREHCPEAIKQTESLRKTPLNEHFEATAALAAHPATDELQVELHRSDPGVMRPEAAVPYPTHPTPSGPPASIRRASMS